MKDKISPNHVIYKKFRQGVFYEDLYEEYDITKEDLISILKRKIKGNYDYRKILSTGIRGQKQFIDHLNNRWNPLEPDAPWKEISPYVAEKTPVRDED